MPDNRIGMNPDRHVERTKRLRIEPVSNDLVRYYTSLEDRGHTPDGTEVIHSLVMEGTISLPDLTIQSLQASATRQPYRECAASVEPLQRIVGMRIGAGFRARVTELIGGNAGCSHFLALVLDLAASHTLSTYLRMRDRTDLAHSDDDDSNWTAVALTVEPRLENACIALATGKRPIVQGILQLAKGGHAKSS